MPSGCNVCNSRIQKLSLLCLCHERLNGHRSDITKKSFLPVSQNFGLSDHSLEDFKRMKILVTVCGMMMMFNVRIGKDFGLKYSVFYIRTVLVRDSSAV